MDVIGRNAAPKLLPGTPNLIVTADHLFVEHRRNTVSRSPVSDGWPGVSCSGILFLRHDQSLDPGRLLIRFEQNHVVDPGTRLPAEVIISKRKRR
jgi:hypothetical protein